MAQQPFLQNLDPEHLQLLVGCASNVRYEAGQFLLREGEEANEFFIIRSGKVAIEIYSPERGPINIETLGEGDVLGWSWLVSPYLWRFDARAMDLTRALVLDGKCLRGKCESDHHLGIRTAESIRAYYRSQAAGNPNPTARYLPCMRRSLG